MTVMGKFRTFLWQYRFLFVIRPVFPDNPDRENWRSPPSREPLGEVSARMARMRFSPVEYARQVRTEIQKITWPSRSETVQSTIAVFIMVLFASLFLFLADQALSWAVKFVLNLNM
jgi:preprotein translocase subunit SecE